MAAESACAAPALAQDEDTRVGECERKRAERARQLEAYKPGKVERGLFYFEDRSLAERLFNPPRGLFARVGGMPEGQGFTAGPFYRISNYDYSFTTSAAVLVQARVGNRLTPRVPAPNRPSPGRRTAQNLLLRRRSASVTARLAGLSPRLLRAAAVTRVSRSASRV